MSDAKEEKEEAVVPVASGLLQRAADAFLKPSVITVLVAALFGPPTVEQINQQIENAKIDAERVKSQRELQTEILAKLLEYANSGGTDAKAMQKISVLTSIVKDNEQAFGLVFPSVPELIAQSQRFERNKLGMEIASLTETLAAQDKTIKLLEIELTRHSALVGSAADQAKQVKKLVEVQVNLDQERVARTAIEASLNSRKEQLATLDRFIEQESRVSEDKLGELVKRLKSEKLDQQQLAKLAEEVLLQAQSQRAQLRQLGAPVLSSAQDSQ
ncbi:MAG: hypothetical protein OEW58_12410 [Gammaproteobacteria bacterium]|nr:hypothetical protein [Gammaproteobacteria bacterium]